MAKHYKIRRFQNGKNSNGEPFYNHSLTIPSEIAEHLPPDMRFEIEILDRVEIPADKSVPPHLRGRTLSGLLFMPIEPEKPESHVPSWAREAIELEQAMERGENGSMRRRPRKRPGTSSLKS